MRDRFFSTRFAKAAESRQRVAALCDVLDKLEREDPRGKRELEEAVKYRGVRLIRDPRRPK